MPTINSSTEPAAHAQVLPPSIHACSKEEIAKVLAEEGQPAFRLDQLLVWIHVHRVASWDEMSNLPRTLRTRLSHKFRLNLPSIVLQTGSADSTLKFLWRLSDGALIESVLIPANPALYSDRADRHTLCVSTQVGCAYGCKFCASGLDGWKRNLTPDEIVGQILATERWHRSPTRTVSEDASATADPTSSSVPASTQDAVPTPPAATETSKTSTHRLIDNLVIMGMGEPLANYDHLLRALRILNAPWGGGIGARKITVSTSGLAPQIRRLADEPEQFRLAISLHGATDAVRAKIMPINRKYPLTELSAACAYYMERKGRMITFEYILLHGVNDALSEVQPLAALARRLHAKVNLIPYNAVEGLPWTRPSDSHCTAFAKALERLGVTTTLRIEKGHDIDAACGQLRLRTEKAETSAQ